MRLKQIRIVPGSILTLLALFACLQGCASLDKDEAQETVSSAIGADSTSAAQSATTTLSRAEIALGEMTLREKAAQVLLLSFSGTVLMEQTANLLASGPPGGLLFFGYNVVDPMQTQELTSALQQTAAATGSPVGLFMAVDQEGGAVRRIKQGVPELPSARKLGTESTPSKAYSLSVDTARGLIDQGFNMNLAPVADVVADEDSFLYSRTYSDDPTLVSEFVVAVIRAYDEQGLIAVVKHFPGHGSALENTHAEGAISGASEQDFEKTHLAPFRAAIAAGVEGIMTAHVVATPYDPDNPASLSKIVIEDLLRSELGFGGLVVADDVSMAAALEHVTPDPAAPETPTDTGSQTEQTTDGETTTTDEQTTNSETTTTDEQTRKLIEEQLLVASEVQALVAALNAGCDLLILTELETRAQAVLDGLVVAIEQGAVSQARLDEAVLRILELKYRHDILPAQNSQTTTTLMQEEG